MKKDFAERLKKARKEAGYESAAAFARAVGVDEAAYRYYERGGSMPTAETLVAIATILGVTTDSLVMPKKSPLAA